jgi:hypothetical protein
MEGKKTAVGEGHSLNYFKGGTVNTFDRVTQLFTWTFSSQTYEYYSQPVSHRAPTPSPPPLRVAKTGENHLNEEITPLIPTGIDERFRQTITNLGHAELLCQCELPL